MNKIIDLRSDTVTKPTKQMLEAMMRADVGDDVYREDPSARQLEEYAADLLGKESALFVMSGVMGNQICLNIHTNPGDEVLCERNAHILQYESGSPAALSGIQLFTIDGKRGAFSAEDVVPYIRPRSAYYMPRSKGIAIENSHNRAGGTIQPQDELKRIAQVANDYGLFFHLDGARIWNAAVATGKSVKELVEPFDSVSCCLSKGLGAPVGSLIAGKKEFIEEAFRVRKAWGGGTRQIGYLAAAGFYALQHHIPRLAEDHYHAKMIAAALSECEGVEIDTSSIQTNIIIFQPVKKNVEQVLDECKNEGLLLSVGLVGSVRIVTHLGISTDDIHHSIAVLRKVLA